MNRKLYTINYNSENWYNKLNSFFGYKKGEKKRKRKKKKKGRTLKMKNVPKSFLIENPKKTFHNIHSRIFSHFSKKSQNLKQIHDFP